MAAYHELWEANANLLKNEHARAVVGSVAVRPGIAGGGRVKGLGTVLLPLVQMTNHGEGTIEYRVLGLDVSFDNDQSSAAGHLEGSIASGDRVLIPAGTIGPYAPGTSGRGQFFFAIAFGKPLSRSTVIERWAFEVEATVLKNGDFDEGVKGTTGNHHLVDAMRPEFVDRPIADLVEMEPGEVALAWRDRLPVNSDRRVS
jgi:hypothetical protein